MTCTLLVLISGNGSNLQAIIDAIATRQLDATITAVISNKADAYGLQRAQAAGIDTVVVEHKAYANRTEFDTALLKTMQSFAADYVVLAGFMRILGTELVAAYNGRMLNIHPSLLPKYPGLNTHQRALDAGDAEHGCSIHFVSADLDGGPVIAQARVPIAAGDTAESLAAKVHTEEHRLYPAVLQQLAQGRLRYHDGQIQHDGQDH